MRKPALLASVILALFVLQYLAMSNTGVGIYIPVGNTLPYSRMNSYLPLPRAVNRLGYPAYLVLKFPLSALGELANAAPPDSWRRHLFPLLTPFGQSSETAVRANHFVFAAVNTALWGIAFLIAFGAASARRRRRHLPARHVQKAGA